MKNSTNYYLDLIYNSLYVPETRIIKLNSGLSENSFNINSIEIEHFINKNNIPKRKDLKKNYILVYIKRSNFEKWFFYKSLLILFINILFIN